MRAGKCVPYIMQQINKFLKDMKKTIKLTVLLAAVLTLAACNPEPVEVERDIVYTVDETTTTVHLRTDAEFDALLEQFCDYAEDGSTVTFYNANRATKNAKDVTHFSTASRTEMKRWMRQMEDAGKTVTVSYDPSSGTYHGEAYATAPHPQTDWVDLGLPQVRPGSQCSRGVRQLLRLGRDQPEGSLQLEYLSLRYCGWRGQPFDADQVQYPQRLWHS